MSENDLVVRTSKYVEILRKDLDRLMEEQKSFPTSQKEADILRKGYELRGIEKGLEVLRAACGDK